MQICGIVYWIYVSSANKTTDDKNKTQKNRFNFSRVIKMFFVQFFAVFDGNLWVLARHFNGKFFQIDFYSPSGFSLSLRLSHMNNDVNVLWVCSQFHLTNKKHSNALKTDQIS